MTTAVPGSIRSVGGSPPIPPGTPAVIARRQASRPGHFMPASLLASQFATLEPLTDDERGVVIDVDQDIDSVFENYLARTGQGPS